MRVSAEVKVSKKFY